MLRANFFYKFFKHKRNSSHNIVKYNSNQELNLAEEINLKIVEIDKKISENSKALVEAQIVKLRSTFSNRNNFIEKIGHNVYKVKLEDSIIWHQKQIKELVFRRNELQINLEKHKGVFWLNQVKRFLRMVLLVFFILFGIFIFFSGFMIIIYLMPIILLIFLFYFIATKK